MLQIILAIIGASLMAAAAFGLVSQVSLQQAAQDVRENNRRLDSAADALRNQLSLVQVGSTFFVGAPAGIQGSAPYAYYQVPAGIGSVNATVSGVPFLYCPIGSTAGSANPSDPEVHVPGGSYKVHVDSLSGLIVGSSIAFDVTLAKHNPAAFLVAAGRSGSAPPSCANIQIRNGQPYVEGGLVRLVNASPAAGKTPDAVINSGEALNAALLAWASKAPSSFTFRLSGSLTPSAGAWSVFATKLASSSASVAFESADGSGALVFPNDAPSVLHSPSNLTIRGIGLGNIQIVVDGGDTASVFGAIFSNAASTPAIVVDDGARLNVQGILKFTGPISSGIAGSGEISLSQAAVIGNGSMQSVVWLWQGAKLAVARSTIGDVNGRTAMVTLRDAGAFSITSDGASAIAASSGGFCWASDNSADLTFQFPDTVSGTSAVGADPAQPVDGGGVIIASGPEYEDWRIEVSKRARARMTNRSAFTCG